MTGRKNGGRSAALKRINWHALLALGFAAAGDGFFDGFEDVGGVIAGAALGAHTGGNIFDEDMLSLYFAGKLGFLFDDYPTAVFAALFVPKGCRCFLHSSHLLLLSIFVSRNDANFLTCCDPADHTQRPSIRGQANDLILLFTGPASPHLTA